MKNMCIKTVRKYNSLDIAKFILAIFVVAIHTSPFYGMSQEYYGKVLYTIAVPVFFVMSSFLFFIKGDDADIKSYCRRMSILTSVH